jgi:hypothetical protein
MFKQDKHGRMIKDDAGKIMWKDDSDVMTEFRRSQMELLK